MVRHLDALRCLHPCYRIYLSNLGDLRFSYCSYCGVPELLVVVEVVAGFFGGVGAVFVVVAGLVVVAGCFREVLTTGDGFWAVV